MTGSATGEGPRVATVAMLVLIAACKQARESERAVVAARPSATDAGAEQAAADEEAEAEGARAREDEEADPSFEKVKVIIAVDRAVKAQVFWGVKRLGATPLSLERDRDSGPLDVIVRAEGYLPVHTRVFTDREDKVTARLFKDEEAPRLLGYKRPPAALPPP